MNDPGEMVRSQERSVLGMGLLFFVTGATALVYQVVWSRQLQLLLGASTLATSAVLTAFMGGFALGAALLGRYADRVSRPLRLYGYLELGVGLSALCVPWAVSALEPVYAGLARGGGSGLTVVRFGLAVLVLLGPTALMGASLPAVVAEATRSGRGVSGSLGRLYGANLAGAVVGALLAGFVLVRELGLSGAGRLAVAANLAVGALAWASARPRPPAPEVAASSATRLSRLDPLLLPLLFVSGFVVLALEVVWARTLVFSMGSTVYGFALVLGVTLAGLALGASLAPRLLTGGDAGVRLALTHAGVAVTAALGFLISPRLFDLILWLAPDSSGASFLAASTLVAGLALLPPATLAGFSFPALASLEAGRGQASGRAVGRAQAINGLGAIAGAAGAGLVLVPWLGLGGALASLLAIELAAGALLLRRAQAPRARVVLVIAAVLTAALLGLTRLRREDALDGVLRAESAGSAPRLIAFRQGRVSTASVLEDSRGRSLRLDGFEAAAIGGSYSYMRLMGLVPALFHPQPERALVICFGTGTTTCAVAQDPGLRELDVVELEPVVLELAPLFEARNRGVLQDPRVRAFAEDGRAYLVGAQPASLDLITLEPMPPTHAGVVTLYSVEFYRHAFRALRPGGVVAQWLPTQFLRDVDSQAIVASLHEVFPESAVFMKRATGIVIGIKPGGSSRFDIGALAARLEATPALARELSECGVEGAAGLAGLCALGPDAVRRYVEGAPLITDDFPRIEHAPLRHRNVPLVGDHTPWQHEALRGIYAEAAQPAAWLRAKPALDDARRLHFTQEMVQLDLTRGDPTAAVERLQRLRDELRTPRSLAGASLSLAKLALLREDATAARALVEEAAGSDPDHPALGPARRALEDR